MSEVLEWFVSAMHRMPEGFCMVLPCKEYEGFSLSAMQQPHWLLKGRDGDLLESTVVCCAPCLTVSGCWERGQMVSSRLTKPSSPASYDFSHALDSKRKELKGKRNEKDEIG